MPVMTTPAPGGARPENGGDIYLTDVGVGHWESMLDTLDIAADRWIDCPVLSAVHIQHCPDGSGSADVQLQLVSPAQIIEVLDHQFAAGHIARVDLDSTTDLG